MNTGPTADNRRRQHAKATLQQIRADFPDLLVPAFSDTARLEALVDQARVDTGDTRAELRRLSLRLDLIERSLAGGKK